MRKHKMLLEALAELRRQVLAGNHRGVGICCGSVRCLDLLFPSADHVDKVACSHILADQFTTWSLFTGRAVHPVPASSRVRDLEAAYDAYNNSDDKYVGEYGALRMQLLDHCIAALSLKVGAV